MSDTSQREHCFADHNLRELPVEGSVTSLAAEVSGLLNRHREEKEALNRSIAECETVSQKSFARAMQFVFHLECACRDLDGVTEDSRVRRGLRRISVIGEQLKGHLTGAGYSWIDPTGHPYEGRIEASTEVDEWRPAEPGREDTVLETREPIVLHGETVILEGAVVIGTSAD